MNIHDIYPYGRTLTPKNANFEESLLIVHLGPMLPSEGGEAIKQLRRARTFKKNLEKGITPNISTVQIIRKVFKKSLENHRVDSRLIASAPYFKKSALDDNSETPCGHYEIHEILWGYHKNALPKSFERYMSYRYGDSPTQWAIPTERENDHYILTRKHHGYRSYHKTQMKEVQEPANRSPIPFGAHVNPRPELALVIKSKERNVAMNLAIIEGKRYLIGNEETFNIENEKATLRP